MKQFSYKQLSFTEGSVSLLSSSQFNVDPIQFNNSVNVAVHQLLNKLDSDKAAIQKTIVNFQLNLVVFLSNCVGAVKSILLNNIKCLLKTETVNSKHLHS